MELPHIGAQCTVKSCSQLDFLPVKCDACGGTFCKDHFTYATHECPSAQSIDYQVPVCPLCNEPVATARGQLPDISVSQHIDNDCRDDRARKNTNRCKLKGCKNKELIPVLCSDCKLNFCLRHRHPSDHQCNPREARIPAHLRGSSSSSGVVATEPSKKSSNSSHSISKLLTGLVTGTSKCTNRPAISSVNSNMSEDEALAHAIAASLDSNNITSQVKHSTSVQEAEDRLMAEAIAASEREAQTSNNRSNDEHKCTMS